MSMTSIPLAETTAAPDLIRFISSYFYYIGIQLGVEGIIIIILILMSSWLGIFMLQASDAVLLGLTSIERDQDINFDGVTLPNACKFSLRGLSQQ